MRKKGIKSRVSPSSEIFFERFFFSHSHYEILDSSQFDIDFEILESLWIWILKPNVDECLNEYFRKSKIVSL